MRTCLSRAPWLRSLSFGTFALLGAGLVLATSDAEAFSVTETVPDQYELGVSPNLTQIEIEFDAIPILADESVRVSGLMSGLHEGTTEVVGDRIVYTITSGPFFAGEMVRVYLHRDIEGFGKSETLTGGYYFTFTVASGVALAEFSDGTAYTAASIPYFIYGGDMDNDGNPDVCAPNEGTHDVSVFLNPDGDGVFDSRTDYGVGEKPSSVFGEDFNNDGWVDLASADIVSGTMSVLINNGDGTMGFADTYNSGSVCRQVTGTDLDGDLDIDLITTARASDLIYFYYNDGTGNFPLQVPFANISDDPFTVQTEDFNNDGHPDIAVGSQNLDRVDILINNGLGGFNNIGNYVAGNGPWDTGANDFDGDGDCDMVVVNSFGNRISILTNDGTGAMTSISSDATEGFPLGVHAADLNGDNHIDAISANFNGASAQVFLNDGTGNLVFQQTLEVQETGSYPWAHDLDGDGDLDISCVDEFGDLLWVFYNGQDPADAPNDLPVRGTRLDLHIGSNPILAIEGATIHLRNAVGDVSGEVHGVDGRLVATLPPRTGKALYWDGNDSRGEEVAPGVYYVRIRSASGQAATGQIHVVG